MLATSLQKLKSALIRVQKNIASDTTGYKRGTISV